MRSEQKAQEILKMHPSWRANVSFVYIPDIATHDAFNEVFEAQEHGFDYVIHTASPINFSVKDLQTELIDPAVQGYLYQIVLLLVEIRLMACPAPLASLGVHINLEVAS